MNLDEAYALFVDYTPQTVHIGMTFDPVMLKGDASAFWLRLSTLDNLVQSAFQTKQRTVFDELNRLVAKELGPYLMKHNAVPENMLHGRTQKVLLGVSMDPKTAIIALIASADVKDIDKMQNARNKATAGGIEKVESAPNRKAAGNTTKAESTRNTRASGEIAAWRKILGGALVAFGNGAQAYAATARAQASAQPRVTIYNAPRTCYTNFMGGTAFTNCYP